MRLAVFFLCFCSVSGILALELKVERVGRGELRGSDYLFTITDGTQSYEYWHFTPLGEPSTPIRCGNLFAYYLNRVNLVVVDGSRKQIIARMVLPDEIREISWKDQDTLRVKVFHENRKVEHTYEISPANPPVLPSSSSMLGYRNEWSDVSQRMELLGFSLQPKTTKKVFPPEEIKAHLDRWAEFDAVNPWAVFYQGLYHYRYQDQEEARRLWGALISNPKAQWYHLLRIATEVYLLEEKDLANSMYEEGMRKYFAGGFEPRMPRTMIELMIHVGSYGSKIAELRKAEKWEEASSLLEKTYEFAPRCEVFAPAMAAFAADLERAGKIDLAKTWRDRAEENRGFEFFGGMSEAHSVAISLALNAIFAAAVAIILFTLLMLLKSPYSHVWFSKDLFKYRTLSRESLLSILLVLVAGVWCIGIGGSKIRGIAQAACQPIGAPSSLDHPALLPWVEKAAESAEKHFLLGLVFQGRGNRMQGEARTAEYAKARAEYAQALSFAQTYNNLALLDKAEGKDPAANFQKALAMDPKMPEALWNTERKMAGRWSEVYRKYCPDRDMLAMPTSDIYNRFLTSSNLVWENFPTHRLETVGSSWYLAVVGLIAVFSVFFLFRPTPAEERPKKTMWWAAILAPGTSRFWSILGCLVTAIWILSLITISAAYQNTENGKAIPYLSSLDSIAAPSLERAFGIEATLLDFDLRWRIVHWAIALAIVLPCLNLAMLLIERRRLAKAAQAQITGS